MQPLKDEKSTLLRFHLRALVAPEAVLHEEGSSLKNDYPLLEWNALQRIATYVSNTLTAGDPALGRPGPVCPFTPASLRLKLLTLTISTLSDESEEGVLLSLDHLQSRILAAEEGSPYPSAELYRSTVIIFPYLRMPTGATLIERVQKRLKTLYVANGLMLGEFYPGCSAPGLYNKSFRPQDTPEICLAIRHITISDGPFIINNLHCVQSFCGRFGMEGVKRLRVLAECGIDMPVECRTFVFDMPI